MNSISGEYLRTNKVLMCIVGQWPHQGNLEKFLIAIIIVPIITAQTILQGGGIITAWNAGDTDAAMEGFAPFIISLMCLCKYINYIYKHEQMKQLLVIIEEDWKIVKSEFERNILRRSYAVGRDVAFAYAVSLYGSMTPFMVLPAAVNVVSVMRLYNISDDHPLMFRIEHFADVENYYYLVLIHSYFGTLGFITIVIAIDSMLVFQVQYEYGICEILRHRLENLIEDDNIHVDLNLRKSDDIPYEKARECVKIHKHIIKYANDIENTNTVSYLFQLGLNMIGISFTEFQAVVKLDKPNESLRYFCFTICLTCVLFLESWPGQQLKDCTDRIFEYTTSGKWYQSSFNVRKLLKIMLMRSIIPLKLTAGRIYNLDLESFSTVVRTSFSYFTVLHSAQ